MSPPRIKNRNTKKNLRVINWNINGVSGKHEHLRLLYEKYDPYIVFLSETKLRTVAETHTDLACSGEYRVVHVRSTVTNRGGIIAIIKTELALITAEIIELNTDIGFAQAIVLTDKEESAYVVWYNSPAMKITALNEELEKLHSDYDAQFLVGDFNARHPRWCTNHDNNRRGTQLLHFIRAHPEHQIHATQGPTFESIVDAAKGTK